jgi:hypothetical protein
MPITVDTTNATATATFEDDHGDAVPAPEGSVVNFASSDTAVLTVGGSTPSVTGDGFTAAITPVVVGASEVSATVSGPTGATLTPPIAAPTPVTVTVGAGPASELVLSVQT